MCNGNCTCGKGNDDKEKGIVAAPLYKKNEKEV